MNYEQSKLYVPTIVDTFLLQTSHKAYTVNITIPKHYQCLVCVNDNLIRFFYRNNLAITNQVYSEYDLMKESLRAGN